jgi:superoxide dismutase
MKPTKLFHCTTPKKAKLYRETKHIISPVRGFDTFQAALAWCVKTGRTVILELDGWEQDYIHKLPDHHNKYGNAFWVDKNVTEWKGVFDASSDA